MRRSQLTGNFALTRGSERTCRASEATATAALVMIIVEGPIAIATVTAVDLSPPDQLIQTEAQPDQVHRQQYQVRPRVSSRRTACR